MGQDLSGIEGFCSGHVKLKMWLIPPSGDIEQKVGYMALESIKRSALLLYTVRMFDTEPLAVLIHREGRRCNRKQGQQRTQGMPLREVKE